jgi:hypothetical protein
MPRCVRLVLTSAVAIASTSSVARPSALFTFHSNPWLNLHHGSARSVLSSRLVSVAAGGPELVGLSKR